MNDEKVKLMLHHGAQEEQLSGRRHQLDDLRLLSKQDIAELFQVSERQVSKLMQKPGFPPKVKNLGRSVRFSCSAVKEFIQNG